MDGTGWRDAQQPSFSLRDHLQRGTFDISKVIHESPSFTDETQTVNSTQEPALLLARFLFLNEAQLNKMETLEEI